MQSAQATMADKPFRATEKNTIVALVGLTFQPNPCVSCGGFGGPVDSGHWLSMFPWSILAWQEKL